MVQHGKAIKKTTHLEGVLKAKTIPHEDYSRYITKTAEFYRYLADLRKSEPKGNVHIINEILNTYDSMIFDKEKPSKDPHIVYCPICDKDTKYNTTEKGYKCSVCGFEI